MQWFAPPDAPTVNQSNYIRISLEAAGRTWPLAEAGPDFVRLVDADTPPAGPAVLVTQMEGKVFRDDVQLGVPESADPSTVPVVRTRSIEAA